MRTSRKVYILILSALMILSMMPFSVFADAQTNSSSDGTPNTTVSEEEQTKSDDEKSSDSPVVDQKSGTDESAKAESADDKEKVTEKEDADKAKPSDDDKKQDANEKPSASDGKKSNTSKEETVPFKGKAGGVEVSVEAPKNAFPEGTTMKVVKADDDDVLAAINDTLEGEAKTVKAVDITFRNADGKEIQPTDPIQVTLKSKAVAEAESPVVVHVDKNKKGEYVGEKVEEVKTDTDKKEVSFEAEHFSVYAVVDEGEDQTIRATYYFQNADGSPYKFRNNAGQEVDNQIIKNGEYLEDVGRPDVSPGDTFSGWYIYKSDGTYGEEIQFGEDNPITVTENATYYVRPVFGDVAYLNFYEDSEGTNIYQRVQVALTDGSAAYDISTQSVTAPKSNLAFMGWSETAGTDNDNRSVITDTNVTVTEDRNFYPVYKSAHWIHFNSNPDGETGASYTAPKYVLLGQTAASAKPANPTWKGHSFLYWSETKPQYDANGNLINSPEEFNFNQTLDNREGDVELYAVWENADTTYTVIFWKQKVTDDKNASNKTYDYAGQETVEARSGSTVYASAYENQYTGFTVDADKSDTSITVKADGSSVINIYFDRKLMTMQFYKYGNNTNDPGYDSRYWTNGSNRVTTYTGLYGQTLAQNGYAWPSGMWTYYTANGTMAMSYLGQFVFGSEEGISVRDPNEVLFRAYQSSTNVDGRIRYFLEQPDGTYVEDETGSLVGLMQFTFSEKYDGYNVYQYKRDYMGRLIGIDGWGNITRYEDGTSRDIDYNWVNTSSGERVNLYDYYGSDWGGNSYYYVYNMDIRYKLKEYKIKFLDSTDNTELKNVTFTNSGANPVTNGVGNVKYTAPLSNYQPPESVVPVSQYPGKVWDGKWYADQACTVEFDWSQTMPNADVAVYAGWQDEWYRVEIDPNGGQLSDTESTYFWVKYGSTIQQYNDVTRNYIEDASGEYYYINHQWDPSWPDDYDGEPVADRDAEYTTTPDSTSDGTKYSFKQDAYSLVGWYKVNDDGTLGEPYDFSTQVTENTKIRAVWRKVGDYRVIYDVDAVDENGNALTKDGAAVNATSVPTDRNTYADKSETAILGKAGAPEGYVFVGWYYNGKVYNPGDVFVVQAELADDDSKVHLKPVFEPYDSVPVRVTHIYWYPNTKDIAGKDITTELSKTVDTRTDETEEYYPMDDLQLNANAPILSATAYQYPGYEFIGWAKDPDATTPWLAYDSTTGKFSENGVVVNYVAADERLPYDNLYALWRVKSYKVTVKKVVDGTAADKAQQFTFTSPALQQANYGLKDGEKKEFENISYGTKFTLTEETGGNASAFIPTITCVVTADDGTKTTTTPVNGAEYTVTGDMEITYTNTRNKQPVSFYKTGADLDNGPLSGGTFKLYKLDSEGKVTGDPLYTLVSDTNGMLISGTTTQFDLELGDYRLIETTAPAGYDAETVDFTVAKTSVTKKSGNATVEAPNENHTSYLFTITDTPLPELYVHKQVEGEYADRTAAFTFTLDLGDDTNEYDYIIYKTTDTNKTAITSGKISDGGTFELKDDQTIMIVNLPVGTEYKVAETNNSNYTAVINGNAEGTMTREDVNVSFTNNLKPITITGIDGRSSAIILVILAALAGVGLFALKRVKRHRES